MPSLRTEHHGACVEGLSHYLIITAEDHPKEGKREEQRRDQRQFSAPEPSHSGGEGGIRTHGTREGSTVFETARFNRSRTSPFPNRTISQLLSNVVPRINAPLVGVNTSSS